MNHIKWMKEALIEAEKALKENEIPIGAVLVKGNRIISKNHNRTWQNSNKLAHAEKLIIDEVLENEDSGFLYDCTLYVTLEPCLMCAGMIIWSRIGKVVYGAREMKSGVCGSIYNVFRNKNFNHHPDLVTGILKEECAAIMKDFFKRKR